MSRLAFRATTLLVVLLLVAGSAVQTQARELRCKCVNVLSQKISPVFVASVVFIPEGPHCVRPEVIVTKKDGKRVCLNPQMPWVERLLQKIINKQRNKL
ncbi:interleukin-8-like [Candoia aspera]|uniref:interleukin-8-like n=1 Tax=Candoia aspera TaxID=51853 RepID=UPI002FD7C65E